MLAELLINDGRAEDAFPLLARALATFRSRRNDGQIAGAATLSAIVSDRRGSEEQARALLGEAFDHHAEVCHPWAPAHDLDLLAVARVRRSSAGNPADDLRWAALLAGAARGVRAEAGLAPLPHDVVVQQCVLDACGAALGEPYAADARQRGESGDLTTAIGWGRIAL